MQCGRLDGIARQSSLGYFNDGHHVLGDDGGFAVAAVAVRLGLASWVFLTPPSCPRIGLGIAHRFAVWVERPRVLVHLHTLHGERRSVEVLKSRCSNNSTSSTTGEVSPPLISCTHKYSLSGDRSKITARSHRFVEVRHI
jgi:hypothetical protein